MGQTLSLNAWSTSLNIEKDLNTSSYKQKCFNKVNIQTQIKYYKIHDHLKLWLYDELYS